MLVTIIFCALIGFTSAQSGQCGRRPLKPDADGDKIVGGVESLRGDWPWSCSLRIRGSHACGGSILNNKWIITAAHCVTSTVVSNYKVVCGLHSRTVSDSWTKEYSVTRVVSHPKYNSRNITNDIALLEIGAGITFSNYIAPACYPAPTDTYEGKTAWALGWGTLSSGGSIAAAHREVSIPVLTGTRCKSYFDGRGYATDMATQVCAAEVGDGKDTCQGDSGGPLVVKHPDGFWYLIGLTSWGIGCGDIGVYTRTSAYRDWVESYTGKLAGPTV